MSEPEPVTIPAALAGERVDRVVALLTGRTRAEVSRLVAAGGVQVGKTVVTTASRRVHEGEVLIADLRPLVSEQIKVATPAQPGEVPFEVRYEDPDVLVVDKPPGVVVHPDTAHTTGTLVAGLLARYPEIGRLPALGCGEADRPGIVHRLDKDTSGLLLVARTPEAYRSLSAQLAARTVGRTYLALACGSFESETGVIDAPIGRSSRDPTRMAVAAGGRDARTHYHVVNRFSRPFDATELELRLETGRTHQIRVHLAAIGHPVVGDSRYRGARRSSGCPRTFLHAARLRFEHPLGGEEVTVTSPLPDDLAKVLARFS